MEVEAPGAEVSGYRVFAQGVRLKE